MDTPTHVPSADPTAAHLNHKSSTLSRFSTPSRIARNMLLVWLDPNLAHAIDDEHRDILNQVRSIISAIHIFSDSNECVKFLAKVKREKVFMIVSGVLGQCTMPHVHDMSRLDSIYVFCGLKPKHDQWAHKWSKVKGVFTQIAPICDSLKQTIQACEERTVSLGFVPPTDTSEHNLDQLDQSFMYTQILKEILLDMQYDERAVKDFHSYCREQYVTDTSELTFLKEFEEDYRKHPAIYWYTHPGCIHALLNRALRTHEVDTIIKMGFFIRDLHENIKDLSMKQAHGQEKHSFIVYRGQGLSKDDFDKLSKAKGGLVSFNSFLSTSKNREVSLEFAQDTLNNTNLVGVLFKMAIDPSELATPYAAIDEAECYFKNEQEILFSMHTVFRIGEMKSIQKNDRLYQVILTLTNSKNKQLTALIELLREETCGSTGWHRLGMFFIKLGKFDEAERVYQTLLEQEHDEEESALLSHQLGLVKRNQGDYKAALDFYQNALQIYEKIRPDDHIDLASAYNNIGQVQHNMGNYDEALSYYERSLRILPDTHPTRAIAYNNIGLVLRSMGNYSQALAAHEEALRIEQDTLPPGHPSLATSYKNIGLVYKSLGEYSKALASHDKALAIDQRSLPANHPALAICYNNIGLLHDSMGNYAEALSFYERTLEIYQKSLPPNHPHFAMSFNNIGSVYKKTGEYAKALIFYKKTLLIEKKSLPTDHPSLAISYGNIGMVYDNMKQYSLALSFHQKALAICQKTLAAQHPMLATLYNNIGSVHDNMGDYQTALTYYQKTLDIELDLLPANHPDLATSYNNIGLVQSSLEQYSQALASHEKALLIYQTTLPANHPDLANSYNNMALACEQLHEHDRALSFYQKALQIRQQSLPSNHLDLLACYASICRVYELMGEQAKALTFYEQFVHAQGEADRREQPDSSPVYANIDQICRSKGESTKVPPLGPPPAVTKETLSAEKAYRLTNFRKKLEKIRQKTLT